MSALEAQTAPETFSLGSTIDIAGDTIRSMGSGDKIVNAMRNNPRDWAMAKLLTVASHHVFSHPSVMNSLSVPARRPIKAIYIKRFIALIDQIQE